MALSNGNADIKTIGLAPYFKASISAQEFGVGKPDPRIFQNALARHLNLPEECMYVGDNPVNDIAPAKKLGMKTALIHPAGKRRDCGASVYVEDLRALFAVIQSR